jgi:hypothetical protein
MGATRAVLIRPDGTYGVTREQLVEGREQGMYPRERVMAIDWTPHTSLGRGLDERTRIRVSVNASGMRAWLGDQVLFEMPPMADDADGKCVCLVAACDTHGASVRFERFQIDELADDSHVFDEVTVIAPRE